MRSVNADEAGLEVLAVPISHTVDCFGYVMREPDKPARYAVQFFMHFVIFRVSRVSLVIVAGALTHAI